MGKIIYLDCGMGAAGDMLTAALLELCPDRGLALQKLNAMGIPGVEYRAEKAEKCGITGTYMHVLVHGEEEESLDVQEGNEEPAGHSHEHKHDHDHHHSHDHGGHSHHHAGMKEITAVIQELSASDFVKENAMAVYQLIAGAESQVHGRTVEEIHFHEVGTLDAVADVAGFCLRSHACGGCPGNRIWNGEERFSCGQLCPGLSGRGAGQGKSGTGGGRRRTSDRTSLQFG